MKRQLFFEFLQVAIGSRVSVSVSINDSDWYRLFDFCKRQALLGIGFTAIEKLHALGVVCPANVRMQWYGYAAQIELLNRKVNDQCRIMTGKFKHDGFDCCIMKGQSNQLTYPEDLKMRRSPGDIDVWCQVSSMVDGAGRYGGINDIVGYIKEQFGKEGLGHKPKVCYHHIDAPKFNGTEVEVHYRPSFLHSPLRNRRLQRWFRVHADECMRNETQLGFSVMTTSVNIIYQMCHLFSHHIEMGLGLRQFMDYYFALRVWQDDMTVMSKEEVMDVISSFGMAKFAAAVMWVLHEVFAMPTHYCICEPDEKEGRRLLDEIMLGGNFGQYDTRDASLKQGGMIKHGVWKLKRVMRLVSSYPEEALWEPVFRVYHLFWRVFHN